MQQTRLGFGWLTSVLLLASAGCAGEPPVTGVGPGGDGFVPADGDDGSPGDGNPADGSTGDGNPADGNPGDGDAGPDDECGSIDKEAEVTRGPVDIVIALDTSGSMSDEICNVSDNLSAFADGVGQDTHVATVYQVGIDLIFQLVLFCGKEDPLASTTLAADANRYLNVPTRVDSTNAFRMLLDSYDSYASFLRPDAPTHFIVVSDDESDSPATTFRTEMEGLLGHPFYFHAIVATGNGCEGAEVGAEYMSLASATGGEQLSICSTDWTALFNELEAAVVASAPLPCDFEIPEPPAGETLDPTKVSVGFTPVGGAKQAFPRASTKAACGTAQGWFFDDEEAPTRIEFCPAACTEVKKGGKLGIAFGCEPPIVL